MTKPETTELSTGMPARTGKAEIRCFTGLRGCAAVLVMAYHFALNMPDSSVVRQQFLLNGYLWVDLFFILSGFVMAYSQADNFRSGYKVRTHIAFLTGRIARIYPLYALVILESAVLVMWRADGLDIRGAVSTLFLNLALVQAWGFAPSLEGAAWSISTEWCAYLIFPALLAAALASARWVATITFVFAAAAIVYLATSAGPFTFPDQNRNGPLDIYSWVTAAPLLRCVAEFTLGLLAYRIAVPVMATKPIWVRAFTWIITLSLLLTLSMKGADIWVVSLFVLLLIGLSAQVGWISKLLGMRLPYCLGQWSYSIYLLHDKFSHPAMLLETYLRGKTPAPAIIAALAMCVGVVMLGALSFFFIERPLRRIAGRYLRKVSALQLWDPFGSKLQSRALECDGVGGANQAGLSDSRASLIEGVR